MKLILLLPILLLIMLMACNNENLTIKIPEKSNISGLASVITIGVKGDVIDMADYFNEPKLIDSISDVPGLKFNYDAKTGMLNTTTTGKTIPRLFEIKVWSKGFTYSLLGKKSVKQEVEISFDPNGKNYKSVAVKGQMNEWNVKKGVMALDKGVWKIKLEVVPGLYQYVFVVDGKEMPDPANTAKVDNNMGGFNSLLSIKGDNPLKLPSLITLKAKSRRAEIAITNTPKEVFVFWQNNRLDHLFVRHDGEKLKILIPENAINMDRSYIRVWAYNEFGISNDLLIPIEKGKVMVDAADIKRTDKEAQILYFMMIDRFNNGDTKNDHKVNDSAILPKANYYGGDVVGITQKIKDGFFKDLGVNTIWLSPITQNPLGAWGQYNDPKTKFSGYHGYWPLTTTTVDFRYGTSAEVKTLLAEAHKQNMNVLLDYVGHHIHKDNALYKLHPDWFTSLYLPDGTMNTERWDDQRLTTWFDTFLPTLDNSKPEVVNPMTDSALFWVKNYSFDGFRHDATKHIPELFWRTLTRKIKKEIPDRSIYQIGETYGSPELISRYVSSGMLDGQFDFNVYDAATGAIGKSDGDFINLNNTLNQSLAWYGDHNLMGYITGNQDRPRFISLAGGSLRWDEDAKKTGWNRDITVGNPTSYDKLKLLQGFIFTIPGIPTVYYGDEIGMPGGNDPDNRRMMKFSGLTSNELSVKANVKKLVELRRTYLPLIYGDYLPLFNDKKSLAFCRTYFGKIAVVAFNGSDQEKKITIKMPKYYDSVSLKANFNSSFTMGKDGEVTITLKPRCFDVLTN
ncbi:MAG: alpha-amylase [Bacteroidetes bacterium]|nr:alpha-amylase [Bacteroidota bacterium]